MDEPTYIQELEMFFKALADKNRLRIIGLLAIEPLTVEEIAETIGTSTSTASHHLSKLAKVGLVSARADGYYSIYQLETEVLESMSKRLLAKESLPAAAKDLDADAYDRKVLNNYLTPDGRLKSIPAQRKKFEAILRHVVKLFEPRKRYPEKEVNELLASLHEDTARLRRSLIEFHLMEREGGGGEYWRIDAA